MARLLGSPWSLAVGIALAGVRCAPNPPAAAPNAPCSTPAPVLEPIPTLTGDTILHLRGTKEPGTGIQVANDRQSPPSWQYAVAPDANRPWVYDLLLVEGDNRFVLRAVGDQCASELVAFSTVADSTPPAPPSLNLPSDITCSESVDLCGIKDRDSSVWMRVGTLPEVQVAAPSAAVTFCVSVDLALGVNSITVFSRDLANNQSAERSAVLTRQDCPPDAGSPRDAN